MAKDIIMDGIGLNADFIRSFESEKEYLEHFSGDQYSGWWQNLSKKDRKEKFKIIYKLAKQNK